MLALPAEPVGNTPARVIGGYAPRRNRIYSLIWLLALASPLANAFGLRGAERVLGIVGLLAFATLYTATFLMATPSSASRDYALVGAQVALAATLHLAFGEGWWLPLAFANASAAFLLPRRIGFTTVLAIDVFAVGSSIAMGWPADDVENVALSMVFCTVILVTVSRLIWVVRTLRLTQERLAHAAVADERLRFSRDMHDLLGHSLTTIVVKSELAARLLPADADRSASELADIQRLARGALADVRETVSGYRDLSLAAELDGARSALAAGGVICSVTPADRALPARVEAVLAWGVREAATNVLRHARARTCSIVLGAEDQLATLDVVDDGVGAGESADADEHGGTGLAGLAERLAAVGGIVRTVPTSAGYHLRAEVPVS